MKKAALVALCLAFLIHVGLSANDPPQAGPNNNVVSGVLKDPVSESLGKIKTDLLLQRQNEPVIAASTRNPDHLLAASNDYRTVEIAGDAGIGETDNSAIARFIAKLFGWPRRWAVPREATAAEAWMGIYRSCDRGQTWIGSLLPGSPNDTSPASMASPLKGLDAATDPVMAALPEGRIAVGGLAFTRGGESKIFSALYEDRNNREGGTCFHHVANSIKVIHQGAMSSTGAFADKPASASDTRGGKNYVYMSYTVFDGIQRDGRVRSKLYVARSTDGAVTWKTTTPKINKTFLRSQGTAIAVDPQTGHVYVIWRLFYDNVMMLVKSTDFGATWGSPITVSWTSLQPFDQGTGTAPDYGFRTNAFPTITAAVVNGTTKLFAAWQERVDTDPSSSTYGQPKAGGSPRIVLTTSADGGSSWTARRAIDLAMRTEEQPVESQPAVPPPLGFSPGTRPAGPQVIPSLNASGGRVMLLYYEARRLPTTGEELGGPSPGYITGIERQMDARVAEIDPNSDLLVAPSVQVSRYSLEPGASPPEFVETAAGYSSVNRPNLPMYKGGTAPFVGDYIFIAPATPFIVGSPWRWPTADDLPSPSFHSVFNDNRMVRYPGGDINGDWATYKPAGDPSCQNPGSRNADIFHSEINDGLVAGSPQTFKQLGRVTTTDGTSVLMQRAFVMYVSNRTATPTSVHLTVEHGTDVDASLMQFTNDDEVDLALLPHSTVTRTVYATSENPTASFRVRVDEIKPDGTLKDGGRRVYVVFNPDPTNPFLGTPDSVPNIDKNETHTPKIDGPKIDRTEENSAYNPQIDSPQIDSPQIDSPQIDSPQIDSPQIDSASLSSDSLTGSATGKIDVVWRVRNDGNTSSAFNSFMHVPNADALINAGWQFQVVVAVVTYTPGASGCQNAALLQTGVVSNIAITTSQNPQIDSPQIDSSNPQIDSPQIDSPQIDSAQISNASFSLMPSAGVEGENSHGEGAEEDAHSPVFPQEAVILLRGIKTVPAPALEFDPESAALLVKAQAVKVLDGVAQGTETDSVFSGPDLAISSGAPTLSQSTVVANDTVTVSGGVIENLGDVAAPPFNVGHLFSTDTIISATDPALSIQPFNDNVGLAKSGSPGSSATFAPTDVVIPFDTTAGSYHLGILADYSGVLAETNRANNAVSTPLVVVPPPSITTVSPLPAATFDSPYSTQLTGADGVPPYTWSAAGLPPGLTLNATTGVISGTPQTVGTFDVTIFLSDAAAASQPANVANHVDTETLSLTVNLPADSELVFSIQPDTTPAGKRLTGSAGPPQAPQVRAQYMRPDETVVGIAGVDVSIALGANPTGATLFGTMTNTTDATGYATLDNVWIDKPGTSTPGSAALQAYTLDASSPGLTTVTSNAFKITAKHILIYGPSFVDTVHPTGAPHTPNEKTLAEAAGYTVTVASATTWNAFSQAQFAAYNAIVIPDPNLDDVCCESPSPHLDVANGASKTTWSNAVMGGPKIVHATDPIFHLHDFSTSSDGGASRLISNSINFAASEPDAGLSVSLSYYYHDETTDTTVTVLDQFGTFTVKGIDADNVKITDRAHMAMAGLTDSTDDCSTEGSCAFHLANWFNSVHGYFTSLPGTWKVLTIDNSSPTTFPAGRPYIISSK